MLVDKPQYIKNAEVRDKYRTRNAAKIAAQVEEVTKVKSKLQKELVPDAEEEEANASDEDDSGSGMDEESMDDIKA